MNNKSKSAIVSTVVIAFLSACGVPQADYDSLRLELTSLRNDFHVLQENFDGLTTDKHALLTERNAVVTEFADFQRDMAVFATLSEEEARVRTEEARLNAEIARLDTEVSARQVELDRLVNLIVRTGEEPRRVGAGHWYVGTDLPPGRFIVSDGNSNFFVNRNGWMVANIILEDGRGWGGGFGVRDYVITLQDGDIIEANTAFTLTPVR